MKRNPNIELYRCLMMFGVVFIHCAYNSIGSMCWENHIGMWCVDGFVLITGYFGTTFSLKKILRLYGLVMVCEVVTRSVDVFVFGGGSWVGFVKECWDGMCSAWFVHAYVLMLCIAPLINSALERKNGIQYVLPFVLTVSLWGLASGLPVVSKYVPRTSGVESYSGLTLAAVYAVGRIVRERKLECKIPTSWLVVLLPVLLMIDIFSVPHHGQWIGGWLGNYASPFAVATAFVVFCIFIRMKIPQTIANVVLFIAPSMFPVYLMHWNDYTYHLMHDVGLEMMKSYPAVVVCLGLAIVLYFGSIIADLPRRMLTMCMHGIGPTKSRV